MNFFDSLRLCSAMIGLGITVQSLELILSPTLCRASLGQKSKIGFKRFLIFRALAGVLLIGFSLSVDPSGSLNKFFLAPVLLISWLMNVKLIKQFGGILSGGSDSMTNLILLLLFFAQIPELENFSINLIAIQCLASYFIAGLIKLKQNDWRSGLALDFFLKNTVYKNSGFLGQVFANPKTLKLGSWIIILTEISFPFLILENPKALLLILPMGAIFHLANSYVFGINRFLYAWIATYPCIAYFAGSLNL